MAASIKQLHLIANTIRQDIIKMLANAGSGHSAGPLGMADVFTALYFSVLKHQPKHPNWENRDILVLSNGHICPVLYATLSHAGYFPKEMLMTLRKLGSSLQGHPHRGTLPGIETTSGPLGSGLSQGIGMALALKIDKRKNRVFVLTSDGEHEEGNTWEAIMLAPKYKLTNLTVLVDRNYIQIDGNTEDICPLESLKKKYEAFNWLAEEINGNDPGAIIKACNKKNTKPTAIICKTTPGKGVSFMEGKYEWHGKPPKPEEAQKALKELQMQRRKLEND
ncbi:transketolase [Candidatus Woesearchaeota archaeon]|nr:transketolase [Candidatus Woesearchaeota archaeon]